MRLGDDVLGRDDNAVFGGGGYSFDGTAWRDRRNAWSLFLRESRSWLLRRRPFMGNLICRSTLLCALNRNGIVEEIAKSGVSRAWRLLLRENRRWLLMRNSIRGGTRALGWDGIIEKIAKSRGLRANASSRALGDGVIIINPVPDASFTFRLPEGRFFGMVGKSQPRRARNTDA
jgi:hypothetical protein